MKMTLNFSQFCDNWPTDRKDQFSYEGKKALFNYLENYTEETNEEVEFDPIALCCDYTEYDSANEAAANYFTYPGMIFDENGDETMTAEEVEKSALKFLEDNTQVIRVLDYKDEETGRIIIQNF